MVVKKQIPAQKAAPRRAAKKVASAAPNPADLAAEEALQGLCNCLAVRRLARVITKLYGDGMAQSGLTIGQFAIIGHALAQPGMSVQALGELLDMDYSTLSRALKPLQSAGFVEQGRAATDARVHVVSVTAAGEAAFRHAAPFWKATQLAVAEHLGEDTTQDLVALVRDAAVRLASLG